MTLEEATTMAMSHFDGLVQELLDEEGPRELRDFRTRAFKLYSFEPSPSAIQEKTEL